MQNMDLCGRVAVDAVDPCLATRSCKSSFTRSAALIAVTVGQIDRLPVADVRDGA